MARLMCLALAVVVVGCGRLDYAEVDAAGRETGVLDGGDEPSLDASVHDASFDATLGDASGDAAPSDAATFDAAPSDAGPGDDAGLCGTVGTACCSVGTSCTEGACLGGVCASMGGAYVDRTVLSTRTCDQPNPLTGACTCPTGFARGDVFEVYRDEGAPVVLDLFFCVPPTPAPVGLVAACERCTCPAGTDTGDHSCPFTGFYMDSFVTCAGAERPADRFRGAYSVRSGACDQPNAYSGACTCPAGSVTTTLGLGCRSATICWRP